MWLLPLELIALASSTHRLRRARFGETWLLRLDATGTTELVLSHMSVECPAAALDVRGYVCVASDGRTSRLWRVDFANDMLTPIGETRRALWNTLQMS